MRVLYHILLALIWTVLQGRFTLGNFVMGLLVSFVVLWMLRRTDRTQYVRRVLASIELLALFLWELLLANLRVARDVMTPGYRMSPGVIVLKLHARSDFEILVLSLMLNLTPDTLALEIADDRSTMTLFMLYAEDEVEAEETLKARLERRLLEITR